MSDLKLALSSAEARLRGMQRIAGFVDALQKMHDDSYGDKYKSLIAPLVEVEWGKRYAKIVLQHRDLRDDMIRNGQRMVYCFVEIDSGDIYKAEGWRKPAKGVRGSIWNDHYDVGEGRPASMYGSGLYIR